MYSVEGRLEDEVLTVTREVGISKPAKMWCVVGVPHVLAGTSGVLGSRIGFGKTLVQLLPLV